ncbi:phosphatase [Christensenellaceae bacterium]|nr:phosphatase [Christensenellaceae bacterium]BDF60802.1 phosphatase [Christensenellaceae bacterium]
MKSSLFDGVEAVVFDLDGVIINSEPIHMNIINNIIRPYGKPLEVQDYQENFVGRCEKYCCGEIKRRYGVNLSEEEMIGQYKAEITRYFEETDNPPILPGIRKLLSALGARRIKMGVASSSSNRNIALSLKSAGLAQYFQAVASAEDAPRGKPHPDVYLNICKELAICPEKSIAIEDSEAGVAAAKAAGFYTVGFRNPDSGKQDLSSADRVIDAFEELMNEEMGA